MTNPNEQTDEDIQKQLAGESVRGSAVFKGKPLAKLTLGLRDIIFKVVDSDDTADFLHAATMLILGDAYSEKGEAISKRRSLIAATDDRAGFRTAISLFLDSLAEEDRPEMKRLWDIHFAPAEKAQVSIVEKKSESDPPVPNQTISPS